MGTRCRHARGGLAVSLTVENWFADNVWCRRGALDGRRSPGWRWRRVAAIVLLSIVFRQRGSAESKPVADPHLDTGA
ncbi:DUF6766 family protein [Gordonia sp. ABSL11-1]|uniref:DUF6766 family protein n=1 Tax=Gordonia sp. ABSL11-1 TaxID=3053924 RepID=UPI0033658010